MSAEKLCRHTLMNILARLTLLILVVLALLAPAFAADKGEVELVYVEWASEVASTNVVKAVLQERLGYDVKITPLSAPAMWQAVASGEADAMVAAWLPSAQQQYWQRVQEDVVNLGPNLEGTRIGLVAPTYVTIDSITDLNAAADKFDNRIIGIDPEAGIMGTTERAMEEYGLTEFELIEGSDARMTAALQGAIAAQEWIVVTGWTPHWKFARWDLKYLDDPRGVYGLEYILAQLKNVGLTYRYAPQGFYAGREHIATIVREGLQEAMPEVYAFLDAFYWDSADMEQVMVWNTEEDANPYETAKRWIAAHPDKVNAWLEP